MLDRTTVSRSSRSAGHLIVSRADELAARGRDSALLLARIALALIFIPSGFGKLMSLDGFAAQLLAQGVPFARVVAPIAATVEFVGSVALLLGLTTRYAALLLALFTLMAAIVSHRFWSLPSDAARGQQINFMKNIAMIGGFFALFVSGAGRFSLDWLMRRVD
jgi:putative oxidoreductase